MKTSKNGIELIKKYEGLRLRAYKAVASEKYYTIGYGHYGADVNKDMVITSDTAEKYLYRDLAKFESYVNNTGLKLTQNQFDALVSFTFNCGQGNLQKLIKGRTLSQIADALLLYNKAGGKVLAGLTKRRKEERTLFLKGYVITVENNLEQVAKEVINGKWGNGTQRRDKLISAGYDYKAVQNEVNRLLKG
jgi:GH24 family phage-related lysozyme (muramidase)